MAGETKIRVNDLNGRLVKELFVIDKESIDLNLDVEVGLYVIQIINRDNIFVRRVCVE